MRKQHLVLDIHQVRNLDCDSIIFNNSVSDVITRGVDAIQQHNVMLRNQKSNASKVGLVSNEHVLMGVKFGQPCVSVPITLCCLYSHPQNGLPHVMH